MVESATAALDGVFHALADPTRRAMLRTLVNGEHAIGELAAPHAMSFAAAAKHVRVLERAGLVRRRAEGRRQICRLAPQPLAAARDWLTVCERLWSESFDALETVLSEPDGAPR